MISTCNNRRRAME